MPELTKKQLEQQGSFDAVDYLLASGIDEDTFEAVLINLKVVQNPKRAKQATEYNQAVRFINKHAPALPPNMPSRRLVIKDTETEESLREVVQIVKKVSAVKARDASTTTQNVITLPA